MCHGVALPALFAGTLFTAVVMSGMKLAVEFHNPPTAGERTASTLPTAETPHADLVPFVHISDLHFSKFAPGRSKRLHTWFTKQLPLIQPSFVLVTGDLTDTNRWFPTLEDPFEPRGPVEAEWAEYAGLRNNYTSAVGWHDMRGNHDGFNAPFWNEPAGNPYARLASRLAASKEATLAHRHYAVDHRDGAGRIIRVVAFDAVPDPAPTRHFFGALSTADLDELAALFAAEPVPAATVLMGHYPFNSLVAARSSAGESLQELMARHRVAASVSGHLHKWTFPLDVMYARHEGGTMELEVADFKYNSAFRLAAFDDGVLSFTDTALGEWPAVLITSPVDARYGNPWNGPQLGAGRNRVRCIVWTEAPLAFVSVRLNRRVVADWNVGKQNAATSRLSTSPLPWHGGAFQYSYFEHGSGQEPVLERVEVRGKAGFPAADLAAAGKPAGLSASVFWVDLSNEELASALRAQEDEEGLPGGTHSVSVTVVDVAGARRVVSQPFTVDGRVVDVPFPVAQWFMTRSFRDLLGGISTALSMVIVYGCLCGALAWEALHGGFAAVRGGAGSASAAGSSVWGPYVALRHVYPAAFWALLALGLYLPLGPWQAGPLFNGQPSALFAWGLLTWAPDGTVQRLPHFDSDIYMVQLFLFGLAPAVQLWSMAALAALPADSAAVGVTGTGAAVTLVPRGGVSSSASLAGLALAAPQMLLALVMPAAVCIFYGTATALAGFVPVYAVLALAGGAVTAVWRGCAPRPAGGKEE